MKPAYTANSATYATAAASMVDPHFQALLATIGTALLGGPQEKMPFFQIAPGPILSSPIHANSSQYDPF